MNGFMNEGRFLFKIAIDESQNYFAIELFKKKTKYSVFRYKLNLPNGS